jgi:hypothetical protein
VGRHFQPGRRVEVKTVDWAKGELSREWSAVVDTLGAIIPRLSERVGLGRCTGKGASLSRAGSERARCELRVLMVARAAVT